MPQYWVFALLFIFVLNCQRLTTTAAQSMNTPYTPWLSGRATFYGLDGWNIMKGSCNYGYIGLQEPLGWDVTALADVLTAYPESCSMCIEVRCYPAVISDNYGNILNRTGACFNPSYSVVTRVTDTCPCTFAPNFYSNRRWCCGDMFHMDMSQWAFEKLASKKWGVMATQYRMVPCSYQPQNPAPTSPEATPFYGNNPSFVPPTRDWPEYEVNEPQPLAAFTGNYGTGFFDASWNTLIYPSSTSSGQGVLGQNAICAAISPNGALAFRAYPGIFTNRISLHFWMYVGVTGTGGSTAQVADININVRNSKVAGCTPQRIYAVSPTQYAPRCTYCTDYWWRWVYYLPGFTGGSPANPINNPTSFSGCGSSSASQLDQIEFRNDGTNTKFICLSDIHLYGQLAY
ncbi:hypothetical protein CEUSTIGMA_g2564.t1 [Chlamydomonas eustigma]|uniref:Expansin-like EG45 domain-containing protein n=1 Tax=Chlamydomonas eustigma TaxID=1157962 RepID=A0A250WX62_9CHLO|nr:hypothetical protein CEUSTIGMA_g2564.t1 [Chlamydomonas eustigma]|eukprot:GAX75120.1 hypothetical protein CEUSTIGMA_g2564.t1 [Chlamydomonas eustigma]